MTTIQYKKILNEQDFSTLTPLEYDLFFGILSIFEENTDRLSFENIPISLLKEIIEKEKRTINEIADSVTTLIWKLNQIQFIDEDENTKPFNIFLDFEVINSKNFNIKFNRDFSKCLISNDEDIKNQKITYLDLKILFQLKGKYQKNIFRILSNFNYTGRCMIKENDMIRYLGKDFEKISKAERDKRIRLLEYSLKYFFKNLKVEIKVNRVKERTYIFTWDKKEKKNGGN